MTSAPIFLLDTNVLVHLIRANSIGQYIKNRYQLLDQPFKPLISIVTVGEIYKLAKRFKWGDTKQDKLRHLLTEFTWIDIDMSIIDAYAEIAYFSECCGNPKGQNDYWIAATARATGGLLLTTDKDFDHLAPSLIRRDYIVPQQ